MVVGKAETLVFETIKEDFKQKLGNISEIESKLSYLLTVDSILVGVLTLITWTSYIELRLKELSFWLLALSFVLLLISIMIGILIVFPRSIPSEIKIEEVIKTYEVSSYDNLLSEIGGTMILLTKNLRVLIKKKGKYFQFSWFLTIGALIAMVMFIFTFGLYY